MRCYYMVCSRCTLMKLALVCAAQKDSLRCAPFRSELCWKWLFPSIRDVRLAKWAIIRPNKQWILHLKRTVSSCMYKYIFFPLAQKYVVFSMHHVYSKLFSIYYLTDFICEGIHFTFLTMYEWGKKSNANMYVCIRRFTTIMVIWS